jgi:hypothetical protein
MRGLPGRFVVQVTRGQMALFDRPQHRLFGSTSLKDVRTSGMEAAILRWLDRTGYIALKDDALSRPSWLGDGLCGE